MVKLVVDLNKCQSYGQCVFAAPTVFRFQTEESLEFDYTPDDALREQVERAAAACPVQAILLGGSQEAMALEHPPLAWIGEVSQRPATKEQPHAH
jgi:ferredoxin